ncbi:O-antigen ligase family protein [Sphingosinicella rhizophila]|uniref:O-antigen ligase family protein n=1 Tax=Sphingosinicella rhizophila TaxID=3050082 RepID=A0ABU3Q8H3_9SPHN|nr:O-antigen ligase family protein [Sphingosinicella sp. GR2756]MDT9599699.1 O-antigen ligase family protein [Sphingosinicella sp. GR2756]
MIHYVRLGLIPAYLLLCLLLGGASAAGYWVNMLLQLLAIPIILWALIVQRSTPMAKAGRQLMLLLFLIVLLVLVQLVPLPPSLWTVFPGREQIADGYRMLDQPLPWLPISLSPHETISSSLWLLPAIAILLGILQLGYFKASWLTWVVVAVAIVSVALGALQIMGGEASSWYFYQITNFGASTGFFSNANHFATLMVVTLPFLAALYLNGRGHGRSVQHSSGLFVILSGALTVIVVGIALNGSLAGLGLSVPVLAATLMMIFSRKKKLPAWTLPVVAVLTLGSILLAFSAPFQNNLTTKEARTSQESRYTSFSRSLEAVQDFAPLGSGIGTFDDIYPYYENAARVTRVYMNHVHGDYIEIVLETGVAGFVLILLFLIWWVRRVASIWGSEDKDAFACAATVASAAILTHSVVDYPLRTVAISAIFAMCCALMAEPRAKVRKSRSEPRESQARHLSAD